MLIDNSDEQCLLTISSVIDHIKQNFTDESVISFAYQIVEARLINVKLPWFIKMVGKLRKFDDLTTVRVVFMKSPGLARETIQSLQDHMLYGTDTSDTTSIGGLNKEELEKLAGIMEPYAVALKEMVDSTITGDPE